MMFLFGIKNQQKKMIAKRQTLLAKGQHTKASKLYIEPVKGYKESYEAANRSYVLFASRTSTSLGLLKSFIPGTREFSFRVIAASRLSDFRKKLHELGYNIEHAKPKKHTIDYGRGVRIIKNPVEDISEKCFPSPIATHKSMPVIKTEGDLPNYQQYSTIMRRM